MTWLSVHAKYDVLSHLSSPVFHPILSFQPSSPVPHSECQQEALGGAFNNARESSPAVPTLVGLPSHSIQNVAVPLFLV